jgi:hypothetical protein
LGSQPTEKKASSSKMMDNDPTSKHGDQQNEDLTTFRTFVGARRHANFFIHIFSHALSSETFPIFLGSHPT